MMVSSFISGLTNGGTSIKSLSGASTGQVNLGGNTLTITNASGIYSGIIQDFGGGGSFVLSGGKQVLAGENTYTGGTTISAGTLQLGNGGTAGSIVGNVT